MFLLISLLLPTAQATPDAIRGALPLGASGGFYDTAVGTDRAWVAYAAGTQGLLLLDLETWDTTSPSLGCDDVRSVAGWVEDASGDWVLAAGCADGQAIQVRLDTSGDVTLGADLQVGEGIVAGMAQLSGTFVALVQPDSGDAVEMAEFPASDFNSVTGSASHPYSTFTGYLDMAALGTDQVMILHSSRFVSLYTSSTRLFAHNGDGTSLLSYSRLATNSNVQAWATDGDSGLLYWTGNSNFSLSGAGDELESTGALAFNGDASMLTVVDEADSELHFYNFTGTSIDLPTEPLRLDLSQAASVDELAEYGDYWLLGMSDGELLVVSERPWVEITAASTNTVQTGDEVSITYTSDTSGAAWLALGSPDAAAFVELDDAVADVSTAIQFNAPDDFVEGENRVFVVVEGDSLEGRAGVDISSDSEPGQVALEAIGVRNESLIVSFEGQGDADLATYRVYVGTEEFSADDSSTWPSVVADAVGDDTAATDSGAVDWPIDLTVDDPEEAVEYTIEGLDNDLTYWVAVVAIDAGGLEGPMSEVLSASPDETKGWLKSNPPNSCASAPATGGALLGAVGLLALFGRRRRASAALLPLGLGLLIAAPAQAGETRVKGHLDEDDKFHLDRSFEVSGGGWEFNDADFASYYGDRRMPALHLEGGVQLIRVLELDIGATLIRRAGNTVTDTEEVATDEEARITMLPLSLSADLRLDIFNNQPVVPFGTVGMDFWMVREREGAFDVETMFNNTNATNGWELGYHYGLGAEVLLDWLEPKRSSGARARWGIHDTYLVGTYQLNEKLDDDGPALGGSGFNVGIKLDFE